MIESTASRGAGVTRSPTGTKSTRQPGAKRSITKRSTRRPHREVRIAIMARPHRVKAYRAVYSCLVARGLGGPEAKKSGWRRSWLKTDGCARAFQSCDRRTPPDPGSLRVPQGVGGRGCGRSAVGRWRGVTVREWRGGWHIRPSCPGRRESRPTALTGTRQSLHELDVGHNRHCHTGAVSGMLPPSPPAPCEDWAVEEWRRTLGGRGLGRCFPDTASPLADTPPNRSPHEDSLRRDIDGRSRNP